MFLFLLTWKGWETYPACKVINLEPKKEDVYEENENIYKNKLGLSEDDLRAMEVVQINAEHPKNGQQEY